MIPTIAIILATDAIFWEKLFDGDALLGDR